MIKKIFTVTIGIPALNEDQNITALIKSLLTQRTKNILVEKIIVSSDGSTDKTVEEVKKIKSKKVTVIDNNVRRGKAYRLNQICKMCTSDILVVVDADIKILGANFLEKLTRPVFEESADLTASRVLATRPVNWVEKALSASVIVKDEIFGKISGGENIYTCHGVARAFSKRLYRRFRFEQTVGEDAFSYLYCVKHGFKYKYAKNVITYIKVPSTIYDYTKQRKRFINSRIEMKKRFGSDLIKKEYLLPRLVLFGVIRKEIFKLGFWICVYLVMNLYATITPVEKGKIGYLWEIARSSKKFND